MSVWSNGMGSLYGHHGHKNFEAVLAMVDVADKTKFQEMSIGHKGSEKTVHTAPIQLNNGNVIVETYNFVTCNDRGLVGIYGKAVKVA